MLRFNLMYSHVFTVDELLVRYGCKTDRELADLLHCSKPKISYWRTMGVPNNYQRLLNLELSIQQAKRINKISTQQVVA